MFLATSWYVDDYNIYLLVTNCKKIFGQINVILFWGRMFSKILMWIWWDVATLNMQMALRCEDVRVFFVFVWGLKLARVDIALGGELSIQNKTLSAFISWCSRLSISSHVIKWCELTLSMNTILRETLFILFISFSS